MLQGLQSMGEAEIAEVARLIELDEASRTTLDQAHLLGKIIGWIGYRVECSHPTLDKIERAALEWIAKDWGLKTDASVSTDDLERSLRIKIAADASEYLAPAWWLAIAFAAAGPIEAIEAKLNLLEKAATLAVPSTSARLQLVDGWRTRCKAAEAAGNPLLDLAPSLAALKTRPERVDQALTLALVVALADGRLSSEEEHMFKDLAEQLGRTPEQTRNLLLKVNNSYWIHQSALGPKDSSKVDDKADKAASLKAAELTLGTVGTLEDLVLEARENVAGVEKKAEAPKSGWQKMVGSLSGLSTYLSSRNRSKDQTTLARIVYLAILRQHSRVVAVQEAHAAQLKHESDRLAAATPRPQASPGVLGEVGQSPARKAIKLDP
jgi:hypothetical protein